MKDIIFHNLFSNQILQDDLFEAIKSGNTENVKDVLEYIHQSGKTFLIIKPKNDVTPLVFAILKGNSPEIIQLLLSHGASSSINIPLGSNNNTPLHMAVQSSPINMDVIRLLLENGAFASIHKKNADGKTPMDIYPALPWKLAIIAESLYNLSIRERLTRQLRQTQLMKQKQRCKKKYSVLSVNKSVSRPESELEEYLRMNYPTAFMERLETIQNRPFHITTLEDLFWGSGTSITTLLPEYLYIFHGTDSSSRRSLQNKGARADIAKRLAYGMGFYTTPSPKEAVGFAFTRYTDNKEKSIAPILLILRVSREKARNWKYPQDFNFKPLFPYYLILKNQEKINTDIEHVETLFLDKEE
jgi:hypothetical protein